MKTVLNLSTAIDTLSFNHDGQMMVMASRLKRDALRWVLRTSGRHDAHAFNAAVVLATCLRLT